MSYDRLGNTRVRFEGKKINIFTIVNEIKNDLKAILPEVSGDRLINMFSHCRNYYYGKLYYGRRDNPKNFSRIRGLTPNERLVYDYLLKKQLNPCTTYRWFIATRIPSDVKDKLVKGQISVRRAMEISANRRRVKESNLGLLMMEELRTIMRGL